MKRGRQDVLNDAAPLESTVTSEDLSHGASSATQEPQLTAAAQALHFYAFHTEYRADGVYTASSFPTNFIARQLAALQQEAKGTATNCIDVPLRPQCMSRAKAVLLNELAATLTASHHQLLPEMRDRKGKPQPRAYAPVNPADKPMSGRRGQGVGGMAGAVQAATLAGKAPRFRALGTASSYKPTPATFPKPRGGDLFTCDEFLVATQGDVIRQLYATGKTETEGGVMKKLVSAVNPAEGKHLYDIVRSRGFTRCLEVGMANGMSTLFIAQAVKDNGGGLHTAVDPFQQSQWGNTAKHQVKRAGLDGFVRHLESKSFLALPRLLDAGETFQFIFIDGMHTFDYTLLDFFYADLLLEPGGVICVDDVRHSGVGACVDYVAANYAHYTLDSNTLVSDTMATFVKQAEDGRGWDYHKDFCRHVSRGTVAASSAGGHQAAAMAGQGCEQWN